MLGVDAERCAEHPEPAGVGALPGRPRVPLPKRRPGFQRVEISRRGHNVPMTRHWNRRAIVFLVLAIAGLIGTWTYNAIAIIERTDFLGDWFANGPAVGSLTMDLLIMAVAACAFIVGSASAYAQGTGPFDGLLQKLRDKGVLSQDEYEVLKAARDEEIQEQRAERRRQALRAAQDAERQEKATEDAESTVTGRFRDGFSWETPDKKNQITLSGRAQLDYRAFGPEGATGKSPM